MTPMKLLAVSSVAVIAIAGSALAQNSTAPAAGANTPANKMDSGSKMNSDNKMGSEIKMQSDNRMGSDRQASNNLPASWRSSKLIGLEVYNQSNEKLGDINELLLTTDGKIASVVIGVGGFLGMGEHDIAVSLDRLTFVETPLESKTSATKISADKSKTVGSSSTASTAKSADDWAPDHAVMQATKDELRTLPQFKYSK